MVVPNGILVKSLVQTTLAKEALIAREKLAGKKDNNKMGASHSSESKSLVGTSTANGAANEGAQKEVSQNQINKQQSTRQTELAPIKSSLSHLTHKLTNAAESRIQGKSSSVVQQNLTRNNKSSTANGTKAFGTVAATSTSARKQSASVTTSKTSKAATSTSESSEEAFEKRRKSIQNGDVFIYPSIYKDLNECHKCSRDNRICSCNDVSPKHEQPPSLFFSPPQSEHLNDSPKSSITCPLIQSSSSASISASASASASASSSSSPVSSSLSPTTRNSTKATTTENVKSRQTELSDAKPNSVSVKHRNDQTTTASKANNASHSRQMTGSKRSDGFANNGASKWDTGNKKLADENWSKQKTDDSRHSVVVVEAAAEAKSRESDEKEPQKNSCKISISLIDQPSQLVQLSKPKPIGLTLDSNVETADRLALDDHHLRAMNSTKVSLNDKSKAKSQSEMILLSAKFKSGGEENFEAIKTSQSPGTHSLKNLKLGECSSDQASGRQVVDINNNNSNNIDNNECDIGTMSIVSNRKATDKQLTCNLNNQCDTISITSSSIKMSDNAPMGRLEINNGLELTSGENHNDDDEKDRYEHTSIVHIQTISARRKNLATKLSRQAIHEDDDFDYDGVEKYVANQAFLLAPTKLSLNKNEDDSSSSGLEYSPILASAREYIENVNTELKVQTSASTSMATQAVLKSPTTIASMLESRMECEQIGRQQEQAQREPTTAMMIACNSRDNEAAIQAELASFATAHNLSTNTTTTIIGVRPSTVQLESPKKSIFDGASKDEILEYLEDARERVPEILMVADDVMVINDHELIVVNQLEPNAPATPISIVETSELNPGDAQVFSTSVAASAAATTTTTNHLSAKMVDKEEENQIAERGGDDNDNETTNAHQQMVPVVDGGSDSIDLDLKQHELQFSEHLHHIYRESQRKTSVQFADPDGSTLDEDTGIGSDPSRPNSMDASSSAATGLSREHYGAQRAFSSMTGTTLDSSLDDPQTGASCSASNQIDDMERTSGQELRATLSSDSSQIKLAKTQSSPGPQTRRLMRSLKVTNSSSSNTSDTNNNSNSCFINIGSQFQAAPLKISTTNTNRPQDRQTNPDSPSSSNIFVSSSAVRDYRRSSSSDGTAPGACSSQLDRDRALQMMVLQQRYSNRDSLSSTSSTPPSSTSPSSAGSSEQTSGNCSATSNFYASSSLSCSSPLLALSGANSNSSPAFNYNSGGVVSTFGSQCRPLILASNERPNLDGGLDLKLVTADHQSGRPFESSSRPNLEASLASDSRMSMAAEPAIGQSLSGQLQTIQVGGADKQMQANEQQQLVAHPSNLATIATNMEPSSVSLAKLSVIEEVSKQMGQSLEKQQELTLANKAGPKTKPTPLFASPANLVTRSLHGHYATMNRLNNYFMNRFPLNNTSESTIEFQCLDCDQFIDVDHATMLSKSNEIRLLSSINGQSNGATDAASGGQTQSKPLTPDQLDRAYIAAMNGLPLCKCCEKKRVERKEIIAEFVDTELKYGRDLKIIHDEFYKPMQIAGLLSKDQINGVFLNLEELIMAHCRFADRLQSALNEAHSMGDTDYNTVNIGRLFVESAEMLHTFESYCIRQASAACLLARLAKEKELLRIFLRVSQMENTLLRRMNLAAFLMVPVQRVTKYPLLLNRLYKVTAYHHKDREALRDAQLKVEHHLEHINQQTKGVGATNKIWRRISNLSAPISNRRCLINAEDIGYIKLRKTAMDMLKWDRDETQFIHSGQLNFAPLNEFLIKGKMKPLRYISAHALLVVSGKPNWKYRPDLVKANLDSKLMTPTQGGTGIREAALLLFREKSGRFVACREPLFLSHCVLSNDCSQFNSEPCPMSNSSQQSGTNGSCSNGTTNHGTHNLQKASSSATNEPIYSGATGQRRLTMIGGSCELTKLSADLPTCLAGGINQNQSRDFNGQWTNMNHQNLAGTRSQQSEIGADPLRAVSSLSGDADVSMSSLKSLPEESHSVEATQSSSYLPSAHTSRSYSLASALPRTTIKTKTSSTVNLAKSSSASSNSTILNQLMTKVNSYHSKQSTAPHNNGLALNSRTVDSSLSSGKMPGGSKSATNSPPALTGDNNKQSTPIVDATHSSLLQAAAAAMTFDPLNCTNHINSAQQLHSKNQNSLSINSNTQQTYVQPVQSAPKPVMTQASSQQKQQHNEFNHYNHHYFHNHHQVYGDHEESFEIHECVNKESMLLRADTLLKTRYWLQILRYHAKDLGHWRVRRPGLANLRFMHQEGLSK